MTDDPFPGFETLNSPYENQLIKMLLIRLGLPLSDNLIPDIRLRHKTGRHDLLLAFPSYAPHATIREWREESSMLRSSGGILIRTRFVFDPRSNRSMIEFTAPEGQRIDQLLMPELTPPELPSAPESDSKGAQRR